MSRCSFDSNIVLYAFTAADDPRQAVAKSLLSLRPSVSVQLLNEFANVARRKFRMDWRWIDEAIASLLDICFEVRPVTQSTHVAARKLAERYKLAFYDACTVASALEARADTLFTEDLQDGLRIDRLTIRNPFT